MPYIGNVVTSFAVETGNINDQAVTAPKLSATGGTDGQVLALDSNLNLEWVSDPAGQWVTSGTDLTYTAGDVGIGTSSPDALLHVSGADTAIIRLENSDTSLIADQIIGGLEFEKRDPSGAGAGVVGGLRMYSKGSVGESVYLTLSTSGSSTNDVEALRIDAAGRLLVGAEDSTDQNAKIQVGTTVREILEGFNYANDALGSRLRLAKSRNTSIGSQTIVQDDDELGLIAFSGSDGSNYRNAALIRGFVDGTPGSGDMPGRLVFSTTTDGSSSPTERMRIDSSGRLLVGTTSAVDTSDEAIVHIVDTLGARLVLGRNDTTVAAGNGLGGIRFAGNDTTSNTYTTLGEILCQADGTHAAGDNPTRLTFKTTANGESSVTERMRIDNQGRIGIGTTSPNRVFEIQDGSPIIRLTESAGTYSEISASTSVLSLRADEGDGVASTRIDFRVDGSETMRIDSDGRLLVGTTSARSVSSLTGSLQIEGTGGDSSTISVTRNVNSAAPPRICLAKSRGASVGSSIVVNSGDSLGEISFSGADGTDANSVAATILCQVDGTPGSNDMPGRLHFSTTADGASTPTERMRIDNQGRISTGAESSPDVSAGGLCLDQNATDGIILSFKSSDINHGMTDYDETDTYFSARKTSGSKGGVRIRSYTDAAGGDPAMLVTAFINSDSDQSYVPITLLGGKKSGAGATNISADRRIVDFKNSDGTRIASFTGTGLTFGNDHAAINALDDYEEGTFEPTFTSTSGDFTSVTYQADTGGRYIKIGSLVTINGCARCTAIDTSNRSGTDTLCIGGLPFANAARSNGDNADSIGSCRVPVWGNTNNCPHAIQARQNVTFCTLLNYEIDNITNTNIVSQANNSMMVQFSLQYRTE